MAKISMINNRGYAMASLATDHIKFELPYAVLLLKT